MKKILFILALLTIANIANADLVLNINKTSGMISITGDGATSSPIDAYLFIEGPGSISGGNVVYPGSLADYEELEDIASNLGKSPADMLAEFRTFLGNPNLADLSLITLADGYIPAAPLQGLLVSDIALAWAGPIKITLVSGDFATVFDTEIISLPEPLTIAMLGLGGLFLRRRRTSG